MRTIRPMTENDLQEVLEVERSAHRQPWSAELLLRELTLPYARVDLCLLDHRLAGFVCVWLLSGELHIHNIATAPAFRRQGVASLLLRHVLERARVAGAERAYLEVRTSNAGAIELYRRFGFEAAARRLRYYPDGEDALLMELDLMAAAAG